MKSLKIKSFDNFELNASLWDNVKNPTGVIQLVHGMSEYSGYYDEFANALNKAGYIVFADNHRAHAMTESDENLGRHKGNVFKKILDDELYLRDWLKAKFDLPVFLVGCGFGSYICQAFAMSGSDVRAIALLGTSFARHQAGAVGTLLFPTYLVARNWRPHCFRRMSEGFMKSKNSVAKRAWLNTNEHRLLVRQNDRYMNVDMSVNFYFQTAKEVAKLYSRKAMLHLDPTTAIGIFYGEKDPLAKSGKSIAKLKKMYSACGIKCEIHEYEGARHEVYYDKCFQNVVNDIAQFFEKFIVYKQTSIEDLVNNG